MRNRDLLEKMRRTKEILTKFLSFTHNKQLDWVCCIRINHSWTIRKQTLIPLLILYLSCFCIILLVFAMSGIFIRNDIYEGSINYVYDRSASTIKQANKQFAVSLNETLNNYLDSMNNLIRIFLTEYNADPIGNQSYCYPVNDSEEATPHNLEDHIENNQINESWVAEPYRVIADEINFEEWGYVADGQPEDFNISQVSEAGQKILKAATTLNYFLEDNYFDYNVNFLEKLFFGFETDRIFIMYPAMKLKAGNWIGYDPTIRPWYQTGKNISTIAQKLGQNSIIYVSGPYYDKTTNKSVLSITKPVMNKNAFMGVLGFNLAMESFQKILTNAINLSNSYIILLNKSGTILNDPFTAHFTEIHQIFDTNFTNLTVEDWNILSDRSTENDTLSITNTVGKKFVVARYFIDSMIPENFYILMLYVETTSITILIEEMKSKMNDTFIWISILEICISISILIVSSIVAAIFINKLIKPLLLLTDYADAINKSSHSSRENKERTKVDISSLKGEGLIGNLINSFKRILKDLNQNKNKRKSEIQDSKEVFSIHYFKNMEIPWKEQLISLRNTDDD